MKKLSLAQQRMMSRLRACGGTELAPGGMRNSGRLASAWFLTARSLEDKGLVRVTSYVGGGQVQLKT
jgi:hypothetical protein